MKFRPSYHLAGASPLSLDVGYLFLVGSNILLSTMVQQLSFNFGVLAEEDEHMILCHLKDISLNSHA